jgi:hypothetical protein
MYDDEPRTSAERTFLRVLCSRIPALMVRLHGTDADPWLCVALDFSEENQVRDTLRLDFDGSTIAGGWSPSFLNGDDGVRAHDAGVDTGPPDGIQTSDRSPEELAEVAAAWFQRHEREWWTSERHARWHRPGLPRRPLGDPDGPWYRT